MEDDEEGALWLTQFRADLLSIHSFESLREESLIAFRLLMYSKIDKQPIKSLICFYVPHDRRSEGLVGHVQSGNTGNSMVGLAKLMDDRLTKIPLTEQILLQGRNIGAITSPESIPDHFRWPELQEDYLA